jgi:hypothetical protein
MQYYLKENVQLKPLFNSWQAHTFLLYPPTAALYCKNIHLTTIESFLQMPLAHKLALQSDEIKGGQYIDYEDEFIPEIEKLCEDTKLNSDKLIQLAESIEFVQKLLAEKADNRPMEELYNEIPDNLKGFIELVYDNLHHPNIRFFEDLFYYDNEYNNPKHQSIALTLKESDHDKGFSSSPILADNNNFIFNIPFSDKRIDEIFKTKQVPKSEDELKKLFQVKKLTNHFMKLFTTEKRKHKINETVENLRIRYFGHASLLFQTNKTTILVDPVIPYDIGSEFNRFSYSDLPDNIDYIVISHRHHDHICIETLLHLRDKTRTILLPKGSKGSLVDPSLKLMLNNIGFKNVIEIQTFEEILFEDGKIVPLPFMGEHSDIDIQAKLCYNIVINNISNLIFIDCDILDKETYKKVKKIIGPADNLFISLESFGAPLSWQYGALMSNLPRKYDEVRRGNGSDQNDAMFLFELFEIKKIYLYGMALEPWIAPILAINSEHNSIIQNNIKIITDEINAKCDNSLELLYGMKEIQY